MDASTSTNTFSSPFSLVIQQNIIMSPYFLSILFLPFQVACIKLAESSIALDNLKLYFGDWQKCQKPTKTCQYIGLESPETWANWFIVHSTCPTFLGSNSQFIEETNIKVDVFFVLVDTIENLPKLVDILSKEARFDSFSKVHFILVEKVTHEIIVLLDVLHSIWSRNIYRFLLVFVRERYEVYSYNSFRKQVVRLSNFAKSCKQLFVEKNWNFHGQLIRAAVFQKPPYALLKNGVWVGRDIELLKQVAGFLNASIELVFDKDINSFHRIYNVLNINKADVIFIRSFEKLEFMNNASCSYPYVVDHKVAVVAAPKRRLQISSMCDRKTFILLAIATMAMFLTVLLTIYINHTTIDLTRSCLDLLRAALGSSIHDFRKFRGTLKLLFIIWIFAFTIIDVSLNTAFTSTLISSSREKTIETLAELKSSGLNIHLGNYVAKSGIIPESLGLKEQYVLIHGVDRLLQERNTSGAIVTSKETAVYYIFKYLSDYGEPVYKIVDESLIPGFNVYTFQKNSLYLEMFDNCLQVIMEHGLEKGRYFKKSSPRPNQSSNPKMTHLFLVFWCFGYSLCLFIVVFFLEIIYCKYFNKLQIIRNC